MPNENEKNGIWITYNKKGYCIIAKDNEDFGYSRLLTFDEGEPRGAKFVSFPDASIVITEIPLDFYARGIKFDIDSSANKPPEDETRAIICIIRRLEKLAQKGAVCSKKLEQINDILHK